MSHLHIIDHLLKEAAKSCALPEKEKCFKLKIFIYLEKLRYHDLANYIEGVTYIRYHCWFVEVWCVVYNEKNLKCYRVIFFQDYALLWWAVCSMVF